MDPLVVSVGIGNDQRLRKPFGDVSNISACQSKKRGSSSQQEYTTNEFQTKKTAIKPSPPSLPKQEKTPSSKTSIRFTSSDLLSPWGSDDEDTHETPSNKPEIQATPHTVPTSTLTINKLQWNFDAQLPDHLQRREADHYPLPDYLQWHPSLRPMMRTQLFDWLMEVGEEYKLTKMTVYIAFYVIDKFLSKVSPVPINRLQLLGATALLIASKLEEVTSICVGDLVFLCEDCYPRHEFHQMERLIAQKLEWKLLPVTPCMWLKIYLYKHYNPSWSDEDAINTTAFPQQEFVRMMEIIDYVLLDYQSIFYPPSHIATAVLYLQWGQVSRANIEEITGLNFAQVEKCVNWMKPFQLIPPLDLLQNPPEFHSNSDYHELQYRNPDIMKHIQTLLDGGDNNNRS
eukprot:TRINITY_DN19628_c0_g1_i1.p1 TRINITY_DN19628_c0_g1~~TRINITY_DN19628_c0_g1_i1.p1  ORF type:complete len:400 (+),score=51.11 TRINITY_DN19628_c0_g1_i1:131-1330(+)